MPSITFWNRLEPRARSNDLAGALAARVRDPAWLLARQWQLGEFQGEDAGSPAYVRIAAKVSPMVAWGVPGQPAMPLVAGAPIERPATAEPFSVDDVSLAVELGQHLDRIIIALEATDLRPHYLMAFPVGDAPGDDPRSARLRALWKGRAVDGLAVRRASMQPPSDPGSGEESLASATTSATAATSEGVVPGPFDEWRPAGVPVTVPMDRWGIAGEAVRQLVTWIQDVYGDLGTEDPTAWRPAHLDYELRAYARTPTTVTTVTTTVLAAEPDQDGDLEWFAFDGATGPVPAGMPASTLTEIKRAVIPGPVRFRGMPNERFWDFEDGRVDFGDLRPDRRSLATMILADFMLVHSNDWFLVPFEQPVGTLCRTDLTVVDVFGGTTAVPRADAVPAPPTARWTMFSTTKADGVPADFFLLPSSSAASVQDGVALEEIRFLRDENANLVWAVEHSTESHLGTARLGHERATAVPSPPRETPSSTTLRYRLQTEVPIHWIPFQPTAIPPASAGQIVLERASLLVGVTGMPVLPQPLGKILAPRGLPAGARYRIREEEIPREGTRVSRLVRRARGTDGRTHLWVSRKRGAGAGEGWSGLRFDLTDAQPADE